MELEKAIQTFLDACEGARPVPVEEFIQAMDIVLDAMRSEITTTQAVKWCREHRPTSQKNGD